MNTTMSQSSTLDTMSPGPPTLTMNTTSISSIPKIATLGPSQLPSFVIPVSVVASILFVFILIGTISFYVWWRIKNRPRPPPLPNPYPENEVLVRYQSLQSVENNNYDDSDDDRILIRPPPSQKELQELIQANKEPIYKNEPIPHEGDSSPIYENCDSPVYENWDTSTSIA